MTQGVKHEDFEHEREPGHFAAPPPHASVTNPSGSGRGRVEADSLWLMDDTAHVSAEDNEDKESHGFSGNRSGPVDQSERKRVS